MSAQLDFEPRQIVCLEHQDTRLYAEVVQIASVRQICWARPLLLVELSNPSVEYWETAPASAESLCDLRQSADLLWPLSLFRPALDTEVIPLLACLHTTVDPLASQQSHQRLRGFVERVWQAHPDKFEGR